MGETISWHDYSKKGTANVKLENTNKVGVKTGYKHGSGLYAIAGYRYEFTQVILVVLDTKLDMGTHSTDLTVIPIPLI